MKRKLVVCGGPANYLKPKPVKRQGCCWDLRAKIIRRLQRKADEFELLCDQAQAGNREKVATRWALRAMTLRREAVDEVLKVTIR